jgi:dihydroorotase-like cyclic amidohydrolase
MHKVDLTIKGGKIVNPTGIVEAGVAIDEGKIVSVAKEPNLPDSDQVINAKGLLILPGAIDPHVHMGKVVREVRRAVEGTARVVLHSKPGVEAHTPGEIEQKMASVV